jgi:hypothetical protein
MNALTGTKAAMRLFFVFFAKTFAPFAVKRQSFIPKIKNQTNFSRKM